MKNRKNLHICPYLPPGGRWQPEGLTDEECGQKSDDLGLAIRPHPISNLSPFLTRHG